MFIQKQKKLINLETFISFVTGVNSAIPSLIESTTLTEFLGMNRFLIATEEIRERLGEVSWL